MTKHPSISENSQTNGAQPSDANPDDAVDYRRPPGQEKTDGERLADSDRGISPALPTKNSNTLSECDSWLGANDEGSDHPNVPASAQSSTYRVDRRLPNGKWRPGVSGNPKGRKPKNPPNDLDAPSALEQALDKKIKVKQGAKGWQVTKRTAILEQWVNQAVQGDHRARRELIAYADKHGIDLFTDQHKTIREGVAEARETSSGFTLTEEVLDRLSEWTLDELTRAVRELEAEKKKKLH